jgi:hypothetical protein
MGRVTWYVSRVLSLAFLRDAIRFTQYVSQLTFDVRKPLLTFVVILLRAHPPAGLQIEVVAGGTAVAREEVVGAPALCNLPVF